MNRIFAPLDDALFDRLFQPLIGFLANRLGITRRAAACLCIDGATAAWLLARAAGLAEAVADWDGANAAARLSVLMVGLVALISLRLLFRRVGTVRANPLRPSMILHRAVILVLIVARVARPAEAPLLDATDLLMLTLTWAGLYLGACSEPPPERRTIRRTVSAEA